MNKRYILFFILNPATNLKLQNLTYNLELTMQSSNVNLIHIFDAQL